MDMQAAIAAVIDRHDLSAADMQAVMRLIMTGQATAAQIGGFLVGLRMKGETVDEIAAAAGVMRELATQVDIAGPHLVDTCGTGGDGASTLIFPRPVRWSRRLPVAVLPSTVTVPSPAVRAVPMCWRPPVCGSTLALSRWLPVLNSWVSVFCLRHSTTAP